MMTVHMLWLFYVTLFIHNAEEIVRGAMAIFSCLRIKKIYQTKVEDEVTCALGLLPRIAGRGKVHSYNGNNATLSLGPFADEKTIDFDVRVLKDDSRSTLNCCRHARYCTSKISCIFVFRTLYFQNAPNESTLEARCHSVNIR